MFANHQMDKRVQKILLMRYQEIIKKDWNGKKREPMAIYVISDIHGCFSELQKMLQQISFSLEDKLYLAGDYIDRGPNSYEMLRWLENRPENVFPIKGNHDVDFIQDVKLMNRLERCNGIMVDLESNSDIRILYSMAVQYFDEKKPVPGKYFDHHGTISQMIKEYAITLDDLYRWAAMIDALPFYYRFTINGRDCIVVHAGYTECIHVWQTKYCSVEDFYVHAREDGITRGGIYHGIIISGHTPTSDQNKYAYNDGKIFRYYSSEKDCIFFDIDCGCAYKPITPSGKLACIRLEDEAVIYVQTPA